MERGYNEKKEEASIKRNFSKENSNFRAETNV